MASLSVFSIWEMCTFVSKCSNSKIHNSESQLQSRMEQELEEDEEEKEEKAAAARGKHCVYVVCSGKRLRSTVIYAFNDRNFHATCVAATHTHTYTYVMSVCVCVWVYKLPFCYLIRKVLLLCKSLDALWMRQFHYCWQTWGCCGMPQNASSRVWQSLLVAAAAASSVAKLSTINANAGAGTDRNA